MRFVTSVVNSKVIRQETLRSIAVLDIYLKAMVDLIVMTMNPDYNPGPRL